MAQTARSPHSTIIVSLGTIAAAWVRTSGTSSVWHGWCWDVCWWSSFRLPKTCRTTPGSCETCFPWRWCISTIFMLGKLLNSVFWACTVDILAIFRFEETNLKSNNCTATERSTVGCIAGISRVYTTIKRLLKEYQSKNAIYLNAGDNFQGTLWYNLLRWNVTASFIKKLRPAVMVSLSVITGVRLKIIFSINDRL